MRVGGWHWPLHPVPPAGRLALRPLIPTRSDRSSEVPLLLVPASWSLLIYSLRILFPSLKSVPTSFYRKALIPSSKLETEWPAALRAPGRGAGWAAGPDRKRRGLPTGRAAATSPALGDVSLGGARLRTSCTAAFPQPVAGRLKHACGVWHVACGVWCVVLRWPVGAGVPAAGPQEHPVSQQRTSVHGRARTESPPWWLLVSIPKAAVGEGHLTLTFHGNRPR